MQVKTNIIYSISKYFNAFRNLFIILSVWAIKEAITRLAFSCPCVGSPYATDFWSSPDARKLYVSLYVLVPGMIFWITGIFLQETTWRCITGWRVQEKFVFPGRACFCFFQTVAIATLAPFAWLFFIFLDGRYYECAEASTPSVCQSDSQRLANEQSPKLVMISQITAYIIAGGAMILYIIIRVFGACCSSMTYYQYRHAQYIQKLEQETFYQATEEFYKGELKKKWKTLFAGGSPQDWDLVSELPPNDPIQHNKRTHYTEFHNWNGVVVPDVNSRHYADDKSVVITIKSRDTDDIQLKRLRDDHIWSTEKHVRRKCRELPALPSMTYSPLDTPASTQNGQLSYNTYSDNRDQTEYAEEEVPPSEVGIQSSTPRVKKKKTSKNKKKNKVDERNDQKVY